MKNLTKLLFIALLGLNALFCEASTGARMFRVSQPLIIVLNKDF